MINRLAECIDAIAHLNEYDTKNPLGQFFLPQEILIEKNPYI